MEPPINIEKLLKQLEAIYNSDPWHMRDKLGEYIEKIKEYTSKEEPKV